ncbi:DUF3238 domain-containing protein [Exiguobacterium sp.]|uniref:DUF3238 domain-containing protein n=1 Tax=Exiguobacterium sp. TaxID=44751 RepID=UPI00263B53AB|nr:DUF3238 domain-containing protein [Exiguobacterium sp.]MCC5891282.1 DUF3238 domain-containing protein [Exiguobacterium sp.]
MKNGDGLITVKPLSDGLELTWSLEGEVTVTRNGKEVFNGSVNHYVDRDTKVGEQVAYRITNTSGEEAKLYTAAVNPQDELYWNRHLTAAVVSQAGTYLQWDPIPDVETYAIYRKGRRIAEVVGTGYIDETPLEAPTVYEVRALRPVKYDQKPGTRFIHAVGKAMSLAKEFNADTRRNQELYVMYFLVSPPRPETATVDEIQLRVQTFIRPPRLKNPNLLSPHPYFEGDGRPYNVHASEYRTRTEVKVEGLEDIPIVSIKKDAGVTRGFNARHQLTGEDVASVDNVYLEYVDIEQGETSYRLQHAVGNPLVIAPDIKYTIVAHLKNQATFKLSGTHTQSPHHEVYLRVGEAPWTTIHRADDLGVSFMAQPMPDCHWTYLTCMD